MKKIIPIILLFLIPFLQSCYKSGKLQIQNNISQVKIYDVEWGDLYIASELLPGESSDKIEILKYDEKLPASHKVSFKMTANQSTIYLETSQEYLLDEDGYLVINLNDDTKVENPN